MTLKVYSVLVIDDDADDHYILEEFVKKLNLNFKLNFYFHANRALQDLDRNVLNTPDAIITDINMPIMDGFDFLSGIKAIDHLRHIPVVVYSTATNIETKKRSLSLGAHSYVSKSSDFNELLKALKAIFGF